MEKILIVEDDPHIAELVAINLREVGCDVTIENDGMAGHDRAMRETFNLLILDINLPKMSGLDICKNIRKHRKYVPIMMMTAKSENRITSHSISVVLQLDRISLMTLHFPDRPRPIPQEKSGDSKSE